MSVKIMSEELHDATQCSPIAMRVISSEKTRKKWTQRRQSFCLLRDSVVRVLRSRLLISTSSLLLTCDRTSDRRVLVIDCQPGLSRRRLRALSVCLSVTIQFAIFSRKAQHLKSGDVSLRNDLHVLSDNDILHCESGNNKHLLFMWLVVMFVVV